MNEKKIEMPDVGGALRRAFGKCPKCNKPLLAGHVLAWCPDRGCGWYGPK